MQNLDDLLNKAVKQIKISEKEERREKYLESERKRQAKIAVERQINSDIANKFKDKEVVNWQYIGDIVTLYNYYCMNCDNETHSSVIGDYYKINKVVLKDSKPVIQLILEEFNNTKEYIPLIINQTVPHCIECAKLTRFKETSTFSSLDFSNIIEIVASIK